MKRQIFMAGTFSSLIFTTTTAIANEGAFKTTLTTTNDYRWRGMSQTFREPALQIGTEYNANNGVYAGAWTSNVSDAQYPGGYAEVDIYGGYRWALTDAINADVGALYYYYPEANFNEFSPPVADEKFDTLEAYGSISYGNLSTKISYSVTDYFGVNTKTANSYGNGDSDGSVYWSLDYSLPVTESVSVIAHAGHTWFRNYHSLNYHDYKLGITTTFAGFNIELSGVSTAALGNHGESFNTYTDGNDVRRVFRPAVVLSIAKSF